MLEKTILTIDGLLAEMIDPKGKSFRVEQLIQKYDYPEDDLNAIDREWH